VDHLTTKTNHDVQLHNLTTKGMFIVIAATIAGNNANNINGKAVRTIGRHGCFVFVLCEGLCVR
jgi:hypothetical protein